MNSLIFIASIALSSFGVALDNLTTVIFINDIGIEFEWNSLLRTVRKRWGYKTWMGIEALVIVLLGLFDSQWIILFFGIIWGVCRSLAATHNFQIISEYRTTGLNAFRENIRSRKLLCQKVSRINRYKMRLQYFVCFLICIVAYEIMFQIGLFLMFSVAALILGMGLFLFMMWIID